MHLFSYDFFQVAVILHKIVIITYKYNMKKIDIKKLLFYILIPLISGAIVGIITSGDMKSYNGFVPSWIFPVVWSILYILMGISLYLVMTIVFSFQQFPLLSFRCQVRLAQIETTKIQNLPEE